MLGDFYMSTPDGDYEVDYRLEVEPFMVDEEGWPVESPPGHAAGDRRAQGVGAIAQGLGAAQPAQAAQTNASI